MIQVKIPTPQEVRGETLRTRLSGGVEAASSRRIPRSTETGAMTGQHDVIAELKVE